MFAVSHAFGSIAPGVQLTHSGWLAWSWFCEAMQDKMPIRIRKYDVSDGCAMCDYSVLYHPNHGVELRNR